MCIFQHELVPGVRVFRFDSPLMFTNCERFRASLYEHCHIRLAAAREAVAKRDEQRKLKEAEFMKEEEARQVCFGLRMSSAVLWT